MGRPQVFFFFPSRSSPTLVKGGPRPTSCRFRFRYDSTPPPIRNQFISHLMSCRFDATRGLQLLRTDGDRPASFSCNLCSQPMKYWKRRFLNLEQSNPPPPGIRKEYEIRNEMKAAMEVEKLRPHLLANELRRDAK